MKQLIFLLFLLTIRTNLIAQTNKSTPKSAKPEIEKLYEKYKDTEILTLFTPHGSLLGFVSIELNDNKKPVSITIHGKSDNKPAIAEFISNTIKMKIKQGYKATKVPSGWNSWNYAELVEQNLGFQFKERSSFQLLMRKGNMYFKVDAGCCAENEQGYIDYDNYNWEIETGDTKRQGGKKATDFEF